MRKFSKIYACKNKPVSEVKNHIKLFLIYRTLTNWQGKNQSLNRKMSKGHGQFTENEMQMALK